jgi:hypothetical protein
MIPYLWEPVKYLSLPLLPRILRITSLSSPPPPSNHIYIYILGRTWEVWDTMDNSILQAKQWKARIKWRSGINIATSTKKQLSKYLNTKLFQATVYEIVNNNLWDLFKHNFKNFSQTTFNRLDLKELLRLRVVLYCGGVFVKPNSYKLIIAQSLVNLVQEKK